MRFFLLVSALCLLSCACQSSTQGKERSIRTGLTVLRGEDDGGVLSSLDVETAHGGEIAFLQPTAVDDTYWLFGAGFQAASGNDNGDLERFSLQIGAEHQVPVTPELAFYGQGGLMHVDFNSTGPLGTSSEENLDVFLAIGLEYRVESYATVFIQLRPVEPSVDLFGGPVEARTRSVTLGVGIDF